MDKKGWRKLEQEPRRFLYDNFAPTSLESEINNDYTKILWFLP